ncbi:MAG: phosphatidic acid phosphatase [Clostridia bacterium]|nr:phosphatidic acid phosphatase [Clostridia bacterium]
MRLPTPEIDYRKFKFSKLMSKEFSHLFLLLYWPLFGISFNLVEKLLPKEACHPVQCALDDIIPFCEIFLLPYLWWFIYMAGLFIYQLFYDVDAFRRSTKFIIIAYTVTFIVYIAYPTCQNLRPSDFERDNFLTRIMESYYAYDTNTNVCPSMHVIGSVAAMAGGLHTKRLQKPAWRIYFVVVAILISISTVFVKQHSALDIFYALPLCLVTYLICFGDIFIKSKKKNKQLINA